MPYERSHGYFVFVAWRSVSFNAQKVLLILALH